MDPSKLPVAMLIGHSFPKSLHDHLLVKYEAASRKHQSYAITSLETFAVRHIEVDRSIASLHMWGKGGSKVVSDFDLTESEIREIKPDIVLLDLGTNDVVQPQVSTEAIIKGIWLQALLLKDVFGVDIVVLCSIVRRETDARMTPQHFMSRAHIVNSTLRELCKQKGQGKIIYHLHRGFWRDTNMRPSEPSDWAKDGIHPNLPIGRRKYKSSLKSALLKARAKWLKVSIELQIALRVPKYS